jgi:cytochrome P450
MIYQKTLRIVAIVSGHVFLGPDLCRREEYLYASINFTVDVFKAVRQLKAWNRWLRPIVSFFTPELKQIQVHRQKARDFLLPIIRERRAALRAGKTDLPDDMLQWTINKATKFNESDEALADLQLTLSMAAIHTTTLQTTDILGELAIRPDVVEELRDEVRRVMADNDGTITTHALFEMKLLDSVMRETQRVNPLNQGMLSSLVILILAYTTTLSWHHTKLTFTPPPFSRQLVRFIRYINKPVTLKSGLHLPAGHVIETPHGAVVSDPALYPSPETFDAHRFARLRRDANVPDPIHYRNREQYQFVAVTKENMSFGLGAHACPGRFFAANEIKLILTRILLHYDVRFPGGVTRMSPRIMLGSSSHTNPMVKMEFRKVREGEVETVQGA